MPNIVVLVPAYNEADSIGEALSALIAQHRVPNRIIVIPNDCRHHDCEWSRFDSSTPSSPSGATAVTPYQLSGLRHSS
jgi:hypothetical protein